MPDTLDPASLDWALKHLQRFGDTDILPPAFEYEAMAHCWTGVRASLSSVDLGEYRTRSHRRLLTPKTGMAFRAAVQLDPIDCVIYTAAAYEAAALVEANRVPRDRRVACSYRIDLDPRGGFFKDAIGWKDYHARSSELATSGSFTHVVSTDISDFYNQIYHHRAENALEAAGVMPDRAKNIEELLMGWTAKQSRGLPVGPHASILLAEATLTDVDSFLLRRGFTHTRYVDDFRVFCDSRRTAVRAVHELAHYLHTAHRLCLQPGKTKVRSVAGFLRHELHDPEQVEEQSKLERLRELIDQVVDATGYAVESVDELPEDDVNAAIRENLAELLEQAITNRPPRYPLIRHLLRRATHLRTRSIYRVVLEHLPVLVPTLRDVVLFFDKTLSNDPDEVLGQKLLALASTSDYADVPFVAAWVLYLLTKRPNLVDVRAACGLAEQHRQSLGVRPYALMVAVCGVVDWVREQKESWSSFGPWDRRALIRASRVLPRDERRAFLDLVSDSDDELDRVVARWVRDTK